MRLAILLATYNGERYLREQLDSLFAQTRKDWTLYAHDDGSADSTAAILGEYSMLHPNMVIMDHGRSGGAMANFMGMLFRVEADLYMFCDQDDVWDPRKVERSLAAMAEVMEIHGDVPAIVHSDLAVVAGDMSPIADSYWRYAGVKPGFMRSFARLGAGNFVTGCTMLINGMARMAARDPTPEAYMHDAWITACVLRKGGVIVGLRSPLVLYRQHAGNSIGAGAASRLTLAYRVRNFRDMLRKNRTHYRMLRSLGYGPPPAYVWAKVLYKLYRERRPRGMGEKGNPPT